MPSARYIQLQDKFIAKQDEFARWIAETRTPEGGYDLSKNEEAHRRDAELNEMYDQLSSMKSMEDMDERHSQAAEERHQLAGTHRHAGGSGGSGAPAGVSHESLGQLVGKALSTHQRSGRKALDQDFSLDVNAWVGVESKATMLTSAGWLPPSSRIPRIADKIAPALEILDLFPTEDTDQATVNWMEETTSTSNAAEILEAGLYPEAALAMTPRTSTVRKIGTHLPLSDEQLGDVPQVASFIDGRLRHFVRKRLDTQLLVGDGIAPNLLGLELTPSVLTEAKGVNPTPDAFYRAMNQVRVTGQANPTAVICHANDWQDIALLRSADGQYIWGHPADQGPPRLWGVPVVLTTATIEGTGFVGDFTQTQLYLRQQAQVEVGWIDDQFIHGLQVVRASLRAALVCFRPQAFCLVTGI